MKNILLTGKTAEKYLHVASVKPFENIALAFSGGGFRAASYALGVLSYLNRAKFDAAADPLQGNSLLQQVTYMSSASGGTITTTLYALYNAQNKTFGEFYVKLFETLTGEWLLENALLILSDKKRWIKRPDKGRNIINAFAMAYNERIFKGATLQSLKHKVPNKAHVQEVCFNTTEFFTGQSFRQDIKLVDDSGADPFYKFGNEVIYLDHSVAKKIKLGDVLAASSCFPAGFEPLIFPNDFTHKDLTAEELKSALTLKPQTGDKQESEFIAEKRVGLMDGGITDNQGLQSMMYADGRRLRGETSFRHFDFMMVNDVGSHFIKPYVMPEQPKKTGLSLLGWYLVIIALFLAAAAVGGYGIYCHKAIPAAIGGIFITIPLVFIGAVYWLKNKIRSVSKSSSPFNLRKSFTDRIIKLLIRYFTKTPVGVLKQMLEARADSVLMLNMSIFLKRIRQLLYDKFYDSPQWKNRGKGNHIYDLSFSNDINRNHTDPDNPPPPPFLNPSRDMQIVAQTAFNMGTTLWFDKTAAHQQHSEACIIACGQFTTCYNLLEYIERLLVSSPVYDSVYQNRLTGLKEQLGHDYERFKTDPFFMYNNAGREYQMDNFQILTINDIPFPENWEQLKAGK